MAEIPTIDLEAHASEPLSYGGELDGYTVVDTDAHFLAPAKDLVEYMDEPWRTRASQVIPDVWREASAREARTSDGRLGRIRRAAYGGLSAILPGTTGDRQQWGKVIREHSAYPDAAQEVSKLPDAMEFLGVDTSIQISHFMLNAAGVGADDGRIPTFFRAYTQYMIEEVLDPDRGIYGFVPLPQDHVDLAVEMLSWVEDHEGLVGGVMLTAGAVPPLGNRKYDPIYELAEDLDVPLALHTSGSGLDSLQGFGSFLETHTLGFMQNNQSQLVSMVFQGVPERYPDLDVVFVESGVAYLPALGARMDEEWLKRTEEAPLLEKRPSEYLREDFYYTSQPLETAAGTAHLEHCFEFVGDRLMYASDYPHWDFDRPTTITNLPFLSRAEKQRILAGNAQEVFGV